MARYKSIDEELRAYAERKRIDKALGRKRPETLDQWARRRFGGGEGTRAFSFVNRAGETVLWVERRRDEDEGGDYICMAPHHPCECYGCVPPAPVKITEGRAEDLEAAKECAYRRYAMDVLGGAFTATELERMRRPVGPDDFGGSDYP